MTPAEIIERLEEAAWTERHLPDKERRHLRYRLQHWPEWQRDWFTGVSDLESQPRIRIVPSPQEIDRMEEVLGWLRWISASRHRDAITTARVIWAKSQGISFRKMQRMLGVHHKQAERWYAIGIGQLARRF